MCRTVAVWSRRRGDERKRGAWPASVSGRLLSAASTSLRAAASASGNGSGAARAASSRIAA